MHQSHITPAGHQTRASAPAKLILCGEHAVVYGRPAIALPLNDLRAYAALERGNGNRGLHIAVPDLQGSWQVEAEPEHPLSELVLSTLRRLRAAPTELADYTITITSNIPVAGGLGSGAAVATALVRAVSSHLERPLRADAVSELVYSCEQRYHGTPSGIDNAVIAHEQAIWFERGISDPERSEATDQQMLDMELLHLAELTRSKTPVEPLSIGEPLTLVLGDTGLRSETRLPVGEVRRRWQADPVAYDYLFNAVGSVVRQARVALSSGDITSLGLLLNENQELLEHMGVSSPELETLIEAARSAGAWGAKLSGGGWGGIMLALADDDTSSDIAEALRQAGASQVHTTQVH